MSEKFTHNDSDNLADIIWWIKGYHSGCEDDHLTCDFSSIHIESLRKARAILDKRNDEIYKLKGEIAELDQHIFNLEKKEKKS